MLKRVEIKLEQYILDNVDEIVKSCNFENRSEFIREAINEKVQSCNCANDELVKIMKGLLNG